MKRTLALMLSGALLGGVLASLVVPPVLVWYNEPGAITPGHTTEMLCNIPQLIRYATRRLLLGQVIGAGVGAALFLVIGLITGRRQGAAAP